MNMNDIIWAFTSLMDGLYVEDIIHMTGIPDEQAGKIYDIYRELQNKTVNIAKKGIDKYKDALTELS